MSVSHLLDKRTNQSFPTIVIVKLTYTKMQCHVSQWSILLPNPRAVSYANIFTSEFEYLLHDYEQRYKHKQALGLRFIDDLSLVWIGDEA